MAAEFYERVIVAAAQPPAERHARLAQLHTEVLAEYLTAVQALPEAQAARQRADGADGRSLVQVVGHIAEWERFAILSAGDILAGLAHPRMITSVDGYLDAGGQAQAFAGIDDFNEYQAAQYAGRAWAETQALALETAFTLHTLFTGPHLLTAERLERTRPFRKRLQNGVVVRDIAMGWNLWITILEHEAVEHAADLSMKH